MARWAAAAADRTAACRLGRFGRLLDDAGELVELGQEGLRDVARNAAASVRGEDEDDDDDGGSSVATNFRSCYSK